MSKIYQDGDFAHQSPDTRYEYLGVWLIHLKYSYLSLKPLTYFEIIYFLFLPPKSQNLLQITNYNTLQRLRFSLIRTEKHVNVIGRVEQ